MRSSILCPQPLSANGGPRVRWGKMDRPAHDGMIAYRSTVPTISYSTINKQGNTHKTGDYPFKALVIRWMWVRVTGRVTWLATG